MSTPAEPPKKRKSKWGAPLATAVVAVAPPAAAVAPAPVEETSAAEQAFDSLFAKAAVREKRRFSEAPGGAGSRRFTEEAPAGASAEADSEAPKRRRKSKWDSPSESAPAPTAAQLSSCANPFELKNYVSSLKDADTAYDQTQADRKQNAAFSYATGTGHMGSFIPTEALAKFNAAALGKPLEAPKPAIEIEASNKGRKMLEAMGWSAAAPGLGATGAGIVAPVMAGGPRTEKFGVGVSATHEPQSGDDDFTLYRKRMMLGYKHRPNPLNNPRSQYY